MSNKTINQFSTDTNLNGGEFILIMTNNVTKNMLLSDVKTFILKDTKEVYITGGTANNLDRTYTFTNSTGGTFNVNSLLDVYVTGGTYSDGVTTFRDTSGNTFDVTGYYTGYTAPVDVYVTGGTYSEGVATFTNNVNVSFDVTGFTTGTSSNNEFITGYTSNNSVLIGGVNNVIDPLANNSVVIGGLNISGVSSNTVYVPNLNINTLISGITVNNLGIDVDGNVVISDLSSLSDLGFNITPKALKVINQNIILPENTDVTYPSPLIMGSGYTITVPTSTTLTII